jgi:hypothetical protein
MRGVTMPIDPLSEETFSLAEAARRLPKLRMGRPVHVTTIWRWALHGFRGVPLETIKIGGIRVTSARAMRDFLAALNGTATPVRPAETRRDAAVEQELDRIGIRSAGEGLS